MMSFVQVLPVLSIILLHDLLGAHCSDKDIERWSGSPAPVTTTIKPRTVCYYHKQIIPVSPKRTARQADGTALAASQAKARKALEDEIYWELQQKLEEGARRGDGLTLLSTDMTGEIFLGEDNRTRILCYNETVLDSAGRYVKIKRDVCMAIWNVEVDPVTKEPKNVIIMAGCHINNPGDGFNRCDYKHCGPNADSNEFCCCNTSMCNSEIFDPDASPELLSRTDLYQRDEHPPLMSTAHILLIGAGIIVLLAFGGIYIMWRLWMRKKLEYQVSTVEEDEINIWEHFSGPLQKDIPSLDLEFLQLGGKIAQGRFGEVFVASIQGRVVAVKQFVSAQREYFLNECRIFTYPHMEKHDSILKFLGATDRQADPTAEMVFWLIVEYHPQGSLIDYLKSKSIDAHTFSTMAYSLASGLSYLHAEITVDRTTKPSMAHRDFNSRNVLVRDDLRLCICDMGFTMPFQDINGGVVMPSGNTKLNDVGTIRYMAPEVLEGILNLRDSPVALRQVDMYAFGLVLWELASRCSDLYYLGRVPDYQLPYQKEAGLNPTFCEMQTLVAKKNARPLFPADWKKDFAVASFIKAMLEELWDTDPEGRLTCGCAAERLANVGFMWGNVGTINELRTDAESEAVQFSAGRDADGPTERTELLHEVTSAVAPRNKSNINELMAVSNQNCPAVAFFPRNMQKYQAPNPAGDRNLKHDLSEEIFTSGNTYAPSRKEPIVKFQTKKPDPVAGERWIPPFAVPELYLQNLNQKTANNEVAGMRSWIGKLPQRFTSMLHRSPPVRSPILPPPITLCSVPLPAPTENKSNIRSGLFSHIARRDVPVSDDSNSTQISCLSPTPSTSGGSPPLRISAQVNGSTVLGMVKTGGVPNTHYDESSDGSPNQVLIDITSRPVMPQ